MKPSGSRGQPDDGCPEDDHEPFEVVIRDRGRRPSCDDQPEQQPVVYGTYGGGYRVPLDEVRRQVTEHHKRPKQDPAAEGEQP